MYDGGRLVNVMEEDMVMTMTDRKTSCRERV